MYLIYLQMCDRSTIYDDHLHIEVEEVLTRSSAPAAHCNGQIPSAAPATAAAGIDTQGSIKRLLRQTTRLVPANYPMDTIAQLTDSTAHRQPNASVSHQDPHSRVR